MEEPPDRLSDPNICRCCLTNNGVWDLTITYDSTVKGVLADIFQDCFGISLLYLTNEGVSRMICKACTDLLRQANYFRNLVQTNELKFREYVDKQNGLGDVKDCAVLIKLEAIEECGVEISLDSKSPLHACITENTSSKDSGERSADINIKSEKTSPLRDKHIKLNRKNTAKTQKTANKQSTPQPKKKRITYSELYRSLRLNTMLMLKNSTLLPFRNKRNTNYKYTCLYCESSFVKIQELREHVDENHGQITEDEILLSLKGTYFTLTKAEVSIIHCKICEKDLENLDNLKQHVTDVHKITFNTVDFKPSHGILGFILESDVPTCYECRKEYPFLRALVAHMTGVHCVNFNCDKCEKKFLLKSDLHQHNQQVHDVSIAKQKCKFCKETFHKHSSKQRHMLRAHGYGKLKCAECNETFMENLQRTKHLIEAHNHKPSFFTCEICQKQFLSSGRLSDHNLRSHRKLIHECKICEKKLSSKTSLMTHIRTHTGETPFACQFCGKRFKSRTILTTHERGHLNDKRYVCELCEAAFIQIHCLRNHYTSRHPDCGIDLKSIRIKKKV